MIRMIQSKSAGHAKAYFREALQKSDYYTNDQELPGQFKGLLADRLGVTGITNKEDFYSLTENKVPKTGKPLTSRTVDDRTIGYDINFHCPKSVSVLHVLSKDDHVMNAFKKSVDETMKDIEADTMTRVRKGGKVDERVTGNLVWADFTHQTARPVDGSVPDPHLHSHCFVFNATWDDLEKEIKAGQFRDIKRDMPYYQARFHKRLSDKLIAEGYKINRTDKSFEVAGVPKNVIDFFSKRTDEIGQFAKEKGITDAKELGELGARTRSKKQTGMSMDELKTIWKQQIKDLGDISQDEKDAAVRFAKKGLKERLEPEHCVDHAISHSFERASVMQERRVLESAYRYSIGNESVTEDAVTKAFEKDERIFRVKENGRVLCTTSGVLKEEKRMVELARLGQDKMKPLYTEAPALKLDGQQADAVSHILTTRHRVSIIRGAAGSGKTTLMGEAVKHIEKAGKKVIVVAPTAEASRGVLYNEGFKEADTVARLVLDQKMQEELKGQVLWVDEAGLLGTKDMKHILEVATRNDARVILGGDTRQHSSVIRGDALRILNKVAGIKTAEVNKIYRQKNFHYRSAVEDLSKGKVRDAFDKLDKLGSIKTVDILKPNEALVDDYVAAVKKGKSALVISPTHKQGDAVTDDIRARLREEKLIGKKELKIKKLVGLNMTEAQKGDWRNFKEGQVIQFNQNMPYIKRGSVWTIKTVKENEVSIGNETGQLRTLPTIKADKFDVFHRTEMGVSKGDKIKITRNGFDKGDKRLNNGQSLEVVSVSKKGEVILINNDSKANYVLDENYGHLTHAHCVTSHSSQGKTVDEVFISQPSSTFPATDAKQFYVSVSRARDSAKIYTDDKTALLEHAAELGDRRSAHELLSKNDLQDDVVRSIQRESSYQKPEPATNKENREPDKDLDYELII